MSNKPYKGFEPKWLLTPAPAGSYRSIFRWGDPAFFKYPKESLYKMMKEAFHMTDEDFRDYTDDIGFDQVSLPDHPSRIAPEHLEVSSHEPHRWEPLLRHAGAIFLGAYTSESLGDYCAGPNHVLPTSGTARFSSPLGVYDFQKRSSLIEVSEQGAQTLGRIASVLAHGEGLQGHARAAEMRLKG